MIPPQGLWCFGEYVDHPQFAGVLEEVDDPQSPGGEASCASWIVTEMAPEASLDHDLRAARKMLGDSAVMLTQLGTEYWRVRLLVRVQHQNLSTPLGTDTVIIADSFLGCGS